MKFQKKNIVFAIGLVILVALFLNHYSFTYECVRWWDPNKEQNINSYLMMRERENKYADSSPSTILLCNQYSTIPSGLKWKRNKQNELLTADFFIVAVGALALAFVMTHKKKE